MNKAKLSNPVVKTIELLQCDDSSASLAPKVVFTKRRRCKRLAVTHMGCHKMWERNANKRLQSRHVTIIANKSQRLYHYYCDKYCSEYLSGALNAIDHRLDKLKVHPSHTESDFHSNISSMVSPGICGSHCKAITELEALHMDMNVVRLNREGQEIQVQLLDGISSLYGCTTLFIASFSPDKWVIHSAYRKDKRVSFFANDMLRYSYIKASENISANLRCPNELVLENVKNVEIRERFEKDPAGFLAGGENSFHGTVIGKLVGRIIDEFGFLVGSVKVDQSCLSGFDIHVGFNKRVA